MGNHKSTSLKTAFLTVLTLLTFQCLFMPCSAQSETPIIYSITPQYIPQGQVTTVTVSGENLPNTVGVTGDDVYVVILKRDSAQKSLIIQLAVKQTASGAKNLIFKSSSGTEVLYPFQIIPLGSPIADNINPNSASPGENILARIVGKNLTSPFITSLNEKILIISSRPSSDGSVVDITLSFDPSLEPGVYPLIISTPYGQTQVAFNVVASNITDNSNSFNADPYSPGIYSIEFDSLKKIITLKGSMFDPDPYKNTVTLLENNNGSVIGRQVEVSYADTDELIVSLPEDIDITSESISFAVSSSDGRSSNIKTIDFNSLNNLETAKDTPITDTINDTAQHLDISTIATNTNHSQNIANNITEENTQPANQIQNSDKQENNDLEDTSIIQKNIQNLSQYIFNNSQTNTTNETKELLITEIKDPAKIISSIEENKQIKNQVDLITIALDEAKENKELSDKLKKAEALKSKVEELEKLLNTEKQKNKPNLRKLAMYEKLLASASAESKSQTFSLLNNLLKYKPQLKNLLTQKPFDLAAIQPNIPNDSIILQYVPTEEGLIIFVVDNKNLKTRINKNITKDMLNKEVQAYRQLFENEIEKINLTGRVTPILSWKPEKTSLYKKEILPLKMKNIFLYNALIAPIEKDIATKKQIAIIANGWLRYLPFQSLAKPTNDGDLHFLISEKSIVYIDSVIALSKESSKTLSEKSSITILANPDGTLTGANKEAEIISRLFSMTTTSLVQKPFNVSLINQLAQKADILHFATHGYLDSSDIDSSYLVSGKRTKGKTIIQEKLFLKDIYDLNLKNSKLVVLSGCDTGKLGNLSNEPDDIVGSLATAFRVAGANTILASLWKAHDEATKIIMQNFYENLKSGLNKAEALRKAELKLKENPKYSHPLFWSLFNLIGDWR